jgi:hypothetical protein
VITMLSRLNRGWSWALFQIGSSRQVGGDRGPAGGETGDRRPVRRVGPVVAGRGQDGIHGGGRQRSSVARELLGRPRPELVVAPVVAAGPDQLEGAGQAAGGLMTHMLVHADRGES